MTNDNLKSLLDKLRNKYPNRYHIILEQYRNCIPHTGKYDVFDSEQFRIWLITMYHDSDDQAYARSIVQLFAHAIFDNDTWRELL